MARRRRARTSSGRFLPTVIRQSSPIIRVSAPRAPKRRHRRRASSLGGGSMFGLGGSFMNHFLGGAAYGYAVKQGWVNNLPALPLVGRTGTAALLLKYFGRGNAIMAGAATAASCLAGYQLGSEGTIHGDASPDSYG